MNGLVITTSTALIGVAAFVDGELVAQSTDHNERRHAEDLTPAIARVTADAGFVVAELDRIVIDIGPGRFTGLRVGVTTARTLATFTGALVTGVTSLSAVAATARTTEGSVEVHAVVDARRGEVFHQGFGADGTPLAEPAVRTPAETVALAGKAAVAGDGAVRYHELFCTEPVGADPEPVALWELAHVANDWVPGPGPLPLYLRGADAKVGKWTLRPGLVQQQSQP